MHATSLSPAAWYGISQTERLRAGYFSSGAGADVDALRSAIRSYGSQCIKWTFILASQNICFITGASGFVGSALRNFLADRDWVVRTDPLRLLEEPAQWQTALGSADCVVHLAAHVHQIAAGISGDSAYTKINVDGSRFVAEQAARAGVRRLVFLSSVKVNGEGGEQPYNSTDDPNPSGSYGRSKLAAESAISEVCRSNNMQCVIIRPPLVYGPGVKANFRSLLRWVDMGVPLPFRSIENRRSLVGLTNLIRFLEICMVHPLAPEKKWFVADDDPVSTPELLKRIAFHMQRRSRLYPFPPSWLRALAKPLRLRDQISRLCDSLVVDISPSRSLMGWHPICSFDDELARTVAAYRAEKNR